MNDLFLAISERSVSREVLGDFGVDLGRHSEDLFAASLILDMTLNVAAGELAAARGQSVLEQGVLEETVRSLRAKVTQSIEHLAREAVIPNEGGESS